MRQQRGAAGKFADDDVLVGSMGAVADRPQPVERRDTKRGSEIPVRAAPATRFLEVHSQSARQFLRASEKPCSHRPFQRRTVDPALDSQSGSGMDGRETIHFRFYRLTVS